MTLVRHKRRCRKSRCSYPLFRRCSHHLRNLLHLCILSLAVYPDSLWMVRCPDIYPSVVRPNMTMVQTCIVSYRQSSRVAEEADTLLTSRSGTLMEGMLARLVLESMIGELGWYMTELLMVEVA